MTFLTTFKESRVEVDSVSIRYLEWGARSRPAVLLLHAVEDCALTWERVGEALASEYRIVAPDLRGHGESAWAADEAYGEQAYLRDVDAVVEDAGLTNFVIGGHGEGGRLAVAYAAEHPERVRAVVASDCDLMGNDVDSGLDGPEMWKDIADIVVRLRSIQPEAPEEVLTRHAEVLATAMPDGGWTWRRDPQVRRSPAGPDLWAQWNGLTMPAMALRGRQSHVMTHEVSVKMREAHTDRVRLVELESAGHWVHRENPGWFEGSLRWFLEWVDAV